MHNAPTTPPKHVLYVDVIVTYHMNKETVGPLTAADAAPAHPLLGIEGIQGRGKIDVPYDAYTTYGEMMAAVQAEVVGRTKAVLGLGISAISKISTCADWNDWDRITGRNSDAEDAASADWHNGKRYF